MMETLVFPDGIEQWWRTTLPFVRAHCADIGLGQRATGAVCADLRPRILRARLDVEPPTLVIPN
jgi:hypothetical protein